MLGAASSTCLQPSSAYHLQGRREVQWRPFLCSRRSRRRAARNVIRAEQSGCTHESRRSVLIALAAVAANPVAPAHADLRTFLQSRQEIYAVAPIGVGQERLREAAELLASAQNEASRRAALNIIRAASLNCYSYETRGPSTVEEKVSLFQQSAPQFVDPCTYRLIAKNVTNLVLNNEADLRNEVNASLQALLRSFTLLDEALDAALDGDDKAAERVNERMRATRESMDRFDRSIKSCLHMSTA